MFVGEDVAGKRGRPQHVEIVYFAEQVLHVLQVVAPGFVFVGKEIFDDVAKAFDADAQGVKRNLRAIAQGAGVQFAGGSPAFEREMFEDSAAGPNAGGAERKRSGSIGAIVCGRIRRARRGLRASARFRVLSEFRVERGLRDRAGGFRS